MATIDSSWSQPDSADNWGELSLQVIGTRAIADIDPFASRLEGISDQTGGSFSVAHGQDLSALMIEEFLDAIRQQRPPETAGDLRLRLVRLLSAAKHSVAHGIPQPSEAANIRDRVLAEGGISREQTSITARSADR